MTRPMTWMTAVRDHPERPPSAQVHVLFALALRMDWQTGCGFASTGQLAGDAQCEPRTVKRATKWGRENEMLIQSRRGHRLGDGRAVASEWRLALPSQQDTGDPLSEISRGQRTHLKGTEDSSQGDSSTPPSRTRSSRPSSSARGADADASRPPATPQIPRSVPPCPYCGWSLSDDEFAKLDDDWQQIALAGEMACENADCPMAVAS